MAGWVFLQDQHAGNFPVLLADPAEIYLYRRTD
ncbi:hypothetical protein QO009_000067 [Brevibacillus aydinogluensis]|jgi:hypothetical protein|nr:hypothetical protein [Brevibacillus aydinogluensis]